MLFDQAREEDYRCQASWRRSSSDPLLTDYRFHSVIGDKYASEKPLNASGWLSAPKAIFIGMFCR
jgi:hypothetical protein